jgi:hypothetical protein
MKAKIYKTKNGRLDKDVFHIGIEVSGLNKAKKDTYTVKRSGNMKNFKENFIIRIHHTTKGELYTDEIYLPKKGGVTESDWLVTKDKAEPYMKEYMHLLKELDKQLKAERKG